MSDKKTENRRAFFKNSAKFFAGTVATFLYVGNNETQAQYYDENPYGCRGSCGQGCANSSFQHPTCRNGCGIGCAIGCFAKCARTCVAECASSSMNSCGGRCTSICGNQCAKSCIGGCGQYAQYR